MRFVVRHATNPRATKNYKDELFAAFGNATLLGNSVVVDISTRHKAALETFCSHRGLTFKKDFRFDPD